MNKKGQPTALGRLADCAIISSAPRCFPSVWVRSGQLKRTVGLTAFFYVSSIAQKHVAVCNLAYISFFVLQNVATRLVALFIVSNLSHAFFCVRAVAKASVVPYAPFFVFANKTPSEVPKKRRRTHSRASTGPLVCNYNLIQQSNADCHFLPFCANVPSHSKCRTPHHKRIKSLRACSCVLCK